MKLLSRLALMTLAAPAAYSQSTLFTFDGSAWLEVFGVSISGAGDVNGDGVPDLIVGAPKATPAGPASGSARVFSGLDGTTLYTFNGNSWGDFLGLAVSGAGDVNGDGFDDLIVGAPFDEPNGRRSGSASVYSGADGSVLYTIDGEARRYWLGYSVSGAGDANGDGFDDFIIGAPFYNPRSTDISGRHAWHAGRARIYSGVDGSVLQTFVGRSEWEKMGFSVSGAGDVNGDGFDDVIIGVIGEDKNGKQTWDDRGAAHVYSGVDGSLLHHFKGEAGSDHLGWSVSGAGDVDGDGFMDLIVGTPVGNSEDPIVVARGGAWVYSGFDGSLLYAFVGEDKEDRLGSSVSGAGDVNGDGFDDLLIGVPSDFAFDRGSAWIASGKDGIVLFTLEGAAAWDYFGRAVSGIGDIDGDGFADLVIASPFEDSNGPDSGSVRVFSGCDALGTRYCSPAVPNSSGQSARISACGSDFAEDGYFMLHATELPAAQFGYFLASETQGFVAAPGGSQGNLCLGGQIARFSEQIRNSGPSGKLVIQVDLMNIPETPPHTVVAGETWNFQAWYRDDNPGSTSNFTDAVSVLFQ